MKTIQSLFFALLVCFAGIAFAGTVNINTADSATLASELTGIGLKKAEAIVEYRVQNGPFKSVDELSMVKGVGENLLEKIRASLTID